jgi:hypothetical protein
MDGMVNICELLINVVTSNKPKALIGLGQTGKWAGLEAFWSSNTDADPPANRQYLTHLLVYKRNLVSP